MPDSLKWSDFREKSKFKFVDQSGDMLRVSLRRSRTGELAITFEAPTFPWLGLRELDELLGFLSRARQDMADEQPVHDA